MPFYSLTIGCMTGKGICKGLQRNTVLFKRYLQHKREQDLQVHHSEAFRLTLESGTELKHWRAYH